MTEYTIAAIPTVYRDRMYRSRLEARWAAFFDRLGWAYEYEPFDLGGWSPDFLLTDLDTLVEVKPWSKFDRATADKIAIAAPDRQLLLTFVAPWLSKKTEVEGDTAGVCIGCFHSYDIQRWDLACLAWVPRSDRPKFVADILYGLGDHDWLAYSAGRRQFSEEEAAALYGYGEYTMKLWADACNAVQWEPER